MTDNVSNHMKVYGDRKNLDIFKRDMAGNDENTVISFQNIIAEPEHISERDGANKLGSLSDRWRRWNWGCISNALWPNLMDEGEYLYYTFVTPWGEPIPIYESLMKRYSALDFEVEFVFEVTDNWVEISSKRGEILKKAHMYWECIPWRDGNHKQMLYRQNLFNDTLQVVEEKIFNPKEHDEVWLRNLRKT